MMKTISIIAVVGALLASGGARAEEKKPGADEAPAVRLYKDGMKAFDEGRYEEALAAFTESYNLSGEAGLLYNLAVCSEKTGRNEKAVAYYELYLEENPEAEDADAVKARLAALRSPAGEAPTPARETPPPVEPETAPTATDPAADVSALERIDAPQKKAPVGPAVLVGTGGLVLAAGLLTAISAYKKHGDLEGSCAPDCTDSQVEPTRNTALAADILMITGGVAAAIGAGWWIATARREKRAEGTAVRVVPAIGASGGALALEGRF